MKDDKTHTLDDAAQIVPPLALFTGLRWYADELWRIGEKELSAEVHEMARRLAVIHVAASRREGREER